jgi:hypothetical protein
MSTIKTFGSVDERSLKQLERCMEAGDAEFGEGYVSPSGVGYDIGCIAEGARVTTRDGAAVRIEAVTGDDAIGCLDRGHFRAVDPHWGAIARGRKPVWAVTFANGRRLRMTSDHRVLTPQGWLETESLREGELVLCQPFVGVAGGAVRAQSKPHPCPRIRLR